VALTEDLEAPARDWLVEALWPQQAVGFIGGPPKAGKSWLALDLAISVATGAPFLGRKVLKTGPVLFFLGEEFLGDVCLRADRLLAGRRLGRRDLGARLSFTENVPCLELEAPRRELGLAASEEKPVLIILDPLERFLGEGDANATKDMRVVNSFLREALTRGCGTSVCVVHHTDKKGKGLRGTGDFRAISEVTLRLGEPGKTGVKVETEMRGSRPPEPFMLRLCDELGGSVRLEAEAKADSGGLSEAAIQLLDEAGPEGVTSEQVRKALGVRNERVRGIMEDVGAVRNGAKGPWLMPDYSHLKVPAA
jgi:hypothetical protein